MANALYTRAPLLFVIMGSLVASGQVTVDATRPGPGLRRPPTAGHFGTIVRELPVRVVLEIKSTPNEAGTSQVIFILTNTGKAPIVLPISPNPRDVEPSNSKSGYTMTTMTLSVSPDATLKRVLRGGATLYGNRAHPNSMFTLLPGKSVRVLTRAALPFSVGENPLNLYGYLGIEKETIKTNNKTTTSDAQGLGYAISSQVHFKGESLPIRR